MQSFSRGTGRRGKVDAKLLEVGWWNDDAWKNVSAIIGRIRKRDIVYKLGNSIKITYLRRNRLIGFINISDY